MAISLGYVQNNIEGVGGWWDTGKKKKKIMDNNQTQCQKAVKKYCKK